MRANYKGFEIEVVREQSLAGNPTLYMAVVRESDGWFLVDTFSESEDTIRDTMADMKMTIDDYLENPEDYEDD